MWFIQSVNNDIVYKMKMCLIKNEIEDFSKYLNTMLIQSSSSFDNYESFYHGIMFMFLNSFGDRYIVESNKESGNRKI